MTYSSPSVIGSRRDSIMDEQRKLEEHRKLPELRAHIDKLLGKGWVITSRCPLKLQSGHRVLLVSYGMLICEGLAA